MTVSSWIGPRVKVLYLLLVTASALAVPTSWRSFVVPTLVTLQVFLLIRIHVPLRGIARMAWRLRSLCAFLVIAYLLLPGGPTDQVIKIPNVGIGFNISGLRTAFLMIGQILTVILASAVVRLSGDERDLVDGLRKFRFPRLLTYSIDNTLALLGGFGGRGRGRGNGGGGGGRGRHRQLDQTGDGKPRQGVWSMLRRLAKGDSSVLINATRSGIDQASVRSLEIMDDASLANHRLVHDVAIVSGVALMMISTKILQVLPGMPFASGHKSLILVPLYLLAATLTFSRWGATTAGTILGMLSFLNGDGRFGLLEIPRHIMPGLLIDAMMPMIRLHPKIWMYSIVGVIAAAGRVSTEFVLTLAIGARWEIYLFPIARISSNLAAGGLSGAITAALLPAFKELEPTAAMIQPPVRDDATSVPAEDTNPSTSEHMLICE
jgi:hypothetical protein